MASGLCASMSGRHGRHLLQIGTRTSSRRSKAAEPPAIALALSLSFFSPCGGQGRGAKRLLGDRVGDVFGPEALEVGDSSRRPCGYDVLSSSPARNARKRRRRSPVFLAMKKRGTLGARGWGEKWRSGRRASRGRSNGWSPSPRARLPVWSWFCRKSTRPWAAGAPRARRAPPRPGYGEGGGGKAFRQRPAQKTQGVVGEVAVVALGPSRGEHMGRVVEIVVPFARNERDGPRGVAFVQMG